MKRFTRDAYREPPERPFLLEGGPRKRSREQRVAWDILRDSPTLRALAILAGPYWPHPAAAQVRRTVPDELAERQVLLAEATRYHRPAHGGCSEERREALLDDALDDTFPASDPPAITLPPERDWPC